MYKHVAVGPDQTMPFLLESSHMFRIKFLGYVEDPARDSVLDPMDATKVSVYKTGELEPGLETWKIENHAECGLHVVFFNKKTGEPILEQNPFGNYGANPTA